MRKKIKTAEIFFFYPVLYIVREKCFFCFLWKSVPAGIFGGRDKWILYIFLETQIRLSNNFLNYCLTKQYFFSIATPSYVPVIYLFNILVFGFSSKNICRPLLIHPSAGSLRGLRRLLSLPGSS